jgi:hypothetical protein
MSDAIPFMAKYDGKSFRPVGARSEEIVRRNFVEGERYELEECQGRSSATHRHFFAALHDAWLSLPEDIADNFLSEEHLRKYALIHEGFSNTSALVCQSAAAAEQVAAFLRPVDEFSVVTVQGKTVFRAVAKSQSLRAMGKAEFQRSKQATLDYVASLIGATTKQLESAQKPQPERTT